MDLASQISTFRQFHIQAFEGHPELADNLHKRKAFSRSFASLLGITQNPDISHTSKKQLHFSGKEMSTAHRQERSVKSELNIE